MSIDSFIALHRLISTNPVFHNQSNNPQAPVEHQLLVALANLGLTGNGGAAPIMAQVFNISGKS
jgi:hypothetical protein